MLTLPTVVVPPEVMRAYASITAAVDALRCHTAPITAAVDALLSACRGEGSQ